MDECTCTGNYHAEGCPQGEEIHALMVEHCAKHGHELRDTSDAGIVCLNCGAQFTQEQVANGEIKINA